jgi:integrase
MKLFQNKSGVWSASFVDQKGQRRFKSLRTTDKNVAEQIAEQIEPQELVNERLPVPKEVARYLNDKSLGRSKNWARDNCYVLKRWADEMTGFDCNSVQEIDTEKLQRWFNQKTRTIKVQTAEAYLFWVKHFLNWCLNERRIILYNAALKVKVPRYIKATRRNFLLLRDAQKLIDHCVDEELRFAIFCAIHAGFRYGETIAARPEWFDLDNKLIHIQVSESWAPKNGKARTVPMSDEFHAFLEVFGLRGPFMIAPEKQGGKYYRVDFDRRFRRLTAQLGIRCTFHDLRRTFASLKVSAGVSIYKVAKWCGHSVEVCEEHYGHLIPADSEINTGLQRSKPAPEVTAPTVPAHRQLTWEELRDIVWSKPLMRVAHDLCITDTALRKMCHRQNIPLPLQGYWNTPPERREKFMERQTRIHKTTA